MEFTINCTRVPLPQGTNLFGIPLEVGPAPAYSGLDSDPISTSETYDELNSNPRDSLGQANSNREEERPTPPNTPFLRCTKNTLVASFNARTLGVKGRLEELAECAKTQSLDILAIQEHRSHHPNDTLQYQNVGQYQFVTSSAIKNSSNASVGGIGFLLSTKASNNLISVESISPRIMIIELEGNPKITIICLYSPHNSAPENEVEEFYDTLRSTLDDIPQHNFLIVLGDFNAKLGPDDVNFTYNQKTNRNGEILLDFMEEYNLFSSNNSYMKPKGQLWTFEYPSRIRAQIDYILYRRKWRNSINDSRSYSSFSTVGSDHRIVSSSIRLSLCTSKKAQPHPMKTIDLRKVSSNSSLSKSFTLTVYNRFQALSQNRDLDLENLDEIYSNITKATEEVALDILPKKKKRKLYEPANSLHVTTAREKLKKVSLEYHKSPTSLKKVQLIAAKKDLDDAYLSAEADYINGKISDISHLHINKKHHAAWKTIKEISGKSSKPTIRLKGGSSENRISNWSDHFKNLLGKEPKTPDNNTLPNVTISETLDISTSDFTQMELNTVIKQLKNKAFGPDNIPPIIWKDPLFHSLLLKLCNFSFNNKSCPYIWRQSQIIPVPKKGDLSLATNFRRIK